MTWSASSALCLAMKAMAQAAAVLTAGSKSYKHRIKYVNALASTTCLANIGLCLATFCKTYAAVFL